MEKPNLKLTREQYLLAKKKIKEDELAEPKVLSFEDIKANMPSSDEMVPINKEVYIKKSELQGSNLLREEDIIAATNS
jgi:hypothetical protein